jgi:hypothetical protein
MESLLHLSKKLNSRLATGHIPITVSYELQCTITISEHYEISGPSPYAITEDWQTPGKSICATDNLNYCYSIPSGE